MGRFETVKLMVLVICIGLGLAVEAQSVDGLAMLCTDHAFL